MRDWTDDDVHVNRIMEAIQPMEEITSGLTTDEYIAVLEHVQSEIDGRIAMAKQSKQYKAEGV